MALIRTAPYAVGETVRLRGPRDSVCVVVAPNGLELRIPAPNGVAEVWLAQAGSWEFGWTDGTTGSLPVEKPVDMVEMPARPEYRGPGSGFRER